MSVDRTREYVLDMTYSLSDHLESLKLGAFYSQPPIEFIESLSDITLSIVRYVSEFKLDQVALRRSAAFLTYLNSRLEELDHACVSDIPIEIVPTLEAILKEYSEDASLFLRGSPKFNYSYEDILGHLRYMLEKSQIPSTADMLRLNRKIGVIVFPSSQRENILLHSVLSHEIGHFLDDILSISEDIEFEINKELLEAHIKAVFQEAANVKAVGEKEITLDRFLHREELRARIMGELNTVLTNWMKEFVADTIAVYLFGPSYLFAFTELSQSLFSPDVYFTKHPPFYLRITVLLKVLEKLDYSDLLRKYPEIKAFLEEQRSLTTITLQESDTLGRVLEESVKPVLDSIILKVDEKIKPNYNRRILVDELDESLIKIRKLVPPNEVTCEGRGTKPVNAVSILNVGWIMRFLYMNDLYHVMLDKESEEEKHQVRCLLNRLLAKAMESRDMHASMRRCLDNDEPIKKDA